METQTGRQPNPPIPGHALLFEGLTLPILSSYTGLIVAHKGGCQCGAQPEGFPNLSTNAVKRWHRQHKADLRAEASV